MDGLLQRIERILDLRRISQRELGRRALEFGLSDERHVGVILGRLRKDPNADVERNTVYALARAGGVSPHWLSTGEGAPEARETTVDRDAEPAPSTGLVPLERAVVKAFAPLAATVDAEVQDDARRVAREIHTMPREGSDLSAMATDVINAVRQLRLEGRAVDSKAVLVQIAQPRWSKATIPDQAAIEEPDDDGKTLDERLAAAKRQQDAREAAAKAAPKKKGGRKR